MQVITHKNGKEIQSRNYKQLKDLEFCYKQLGAETQMILRDGCDQMWLLRVKEGHDREFAENMGKSYNP